MSIDETERVTFKWKVRSYLHGTECRVLSPFEVNLISRTTFRVGMQLKRDSLENRITYTLIRVDDHQPEKIAINYEFSIIAIDSSVKKMVPMSFLFSKYKGSILASFAQERKLSRTGFFNTHAVSCFMWRNKVEVVYTEHWFARTPLSIHRVCGKWEIDRFSHLKRYKQRTYSISCPTEENIFIVPKLFWFDPDAELSIGIILSGLEEELFLRCRISVLDFEGNADITEQGEHVFHKGDLKLWRFPPFIKRSWLLANKEKYLPNDILTLSCEIFNFNDNSTPSSEMFHSGGDLCQEVIESPTTNSLKDGLLTLYQEKKFCNAILQTKNTSFPVHKAVLCARSSVFSAIFEKDLDKTGIVDISDLTDETVHQMVMFMYTDSLEVFEWENALSLYTASDMFDIVPLKNKCSTFLKDNFDVSNAMEVLVLADLLQDEDMKSALHDFIFERDSEIINTDEWEKFMLENLQLAAKTLHLVYLRKLGI